LKDGDVSKIAVIDKGSMVVAVLLAWWFLKEQVSPRTLLGAGLMVAGLVVIAKR
jgi:transporter family protein